MTSQVSLKNIGKISQKGYKSLKPRSKESFGYYKKHKEERENDAYFRDRLRTLQKGEKMPKTYYKRTALERKHQARGQLYHF